MNVLFTHPFFWPHVRRGAERGIAELGGRLHGHGHPVRLLTTAPDGTRRERISNIDVRFVGVPLPNAARRRGLNEVNAFAAVVLPWLLASSGDVVHTWLYGDAWAAAQARRVRHRPTILTLTGVVEVDRMARLRVDNALLRGALEGVDEVWCLSEFARTAMEPFGREMQVVPFGIELDRFAPGEDRWPEPVLLCTSCPDEPRKLIADALAAWPLVVEAFPTARLRLAGSASRATRDRLLAAVPRARQDTIEFLGERSDSELVTEYQRAWATLMPGHEEAQGLATLESLACGTPVAGLRSGATPELVGDDGGQLYERGDPQGCATAVTACFARGSDPSTVARCRARAAPFDWAAIVDDVLRRYRTLLR